MGLTIHSNANLIVLLVATAIFLGCIASPPSLMDDVDAANAQVARHILASGDWVTPHLNGVPDMEKPPLQYWLMALSYGVFGVHDWAARLPLALVTIALCWLTARFGAWAFGATIGVYTGVVLATCAGLCLFTRFLIPDAVLTCTVTTARWSFLRTLDDQEPRPRLWAWLTAASLGTGVLAKGLLGLIVPGGAAVVYLLYTRQLVAHHTWEWLRPLSGCVVLLAIAAPWHVLATLRNPPYFAFTLHSGPGQYHGFLWFYFINEHVLRFLNMRYPRDYDTVPRLAFWLLHLVGLFPWSVFSPALARLDYRLTSRAGRTRCLALCWTAFLLVFLSFSTTQEYYALPCYPALALLLGSGLATEDVWVQRGARLLAIIAALAVALIAAILLALRSVPTPGDISPTLTDNPEAYKLSLGHLQDLTRASFAYMRVPLGLAGSAVLVGAIGAWRFSQRWSVLALALMMVLFAQAARLAQAVLDPSMSHRPIADALVHAPPGRLIVDGEYHAFASVFFSTNRQGLLLNGRMNDLEYGSYARHAALVFIDAAAWQELWRGPARGYLVTTRSDIPRLEQLVGSSVLHSVMESGSKVLLTNEQQ